MAQTTIDDYAEKYSEQLREKVKEIIAKRDEAFVDKYFEDYSYTPEEDKNDTNREG